jgi:uncharacterized protein with PQ loop repeat
MNSVGLMGSLLLTFSAVPELVRTIKDGKCHMGWGFLSMWFVGEIFCTFYGFDLREVPLMLNYTFNLGVSGLMVFYKLKELDVNFIKIKKIRA